MRRMDCLEGKHVVQKLQYLNSFSPGGNKNLLAVTYKIVLLQRSYNPNR